MRTKKIIIFYLIIILFILTIYFPTANASECEYGTMKAWFSKDGSTWQNATVENVTCRRGEPFFIKTTVKPSNDLLSIDIKIWETGENNAENSTYELLEGPNCYFRFIDIYPVLINNSYTYIWKLQVKPDTEWVNGNSPLNIYTQFDKTDKDNEGIYFTIANLFIEDNLWSNYTENSNDSNDSDSLAITNSELPTQNTIKTHDFKITLILFAVLLIICWKQKKKKGVF